ncbi:MAG: FecR domain-containing protein [Bacteroidales bacterium]|nr:FecR domain-containing protein [Bacteroidales bacterium]
MENNDKYMFEAEEINSVQDFNEQKDLYSIYLQAGKIDTDKAWSNVSAMLAPRKRTRVFKLWYAAAAAAAAVIIAVTLTFTLKDPIKYQQYTANTACETITLPDSSTVCLNQGAVIEFQENFNGEERLVKFSGEGYFDIVHNDSKPFVIKSGKNTVKVLGTEFNLIAKDDNNIKVSVTDGCVSLQNDEGNITVSKNEEATAAKNEKPQKNKISDNVLQWQSKMLDFKDCTLQKAVEKLSYVYGVEISIENPSLNNLKLTSRYQNAKIEDVMQGLSTIYGIKAEMSPVTGVWILQ